MSDAYRIAMERIAIAALSTGKVWPYAVEIDEATDGYRVTGRCWRCMSLPVTVVSHVAAFVRVDHGELAARIRDGLGCYCVEPKWQADADRDYEASRAAWAVAGDWDKAVRLSRARSALNYPNRTTVEERDGAHHLVDTDTNRSHPL